MSCDGILFKCARKHRLPESMFIPKSNESIISMFFPSSKCKQMDDLKIILEFSAGAELLFGNIKRRQLCLDGHKKWTIANLLKWMHANILTERPELFLQGDTVRPGILVLINDTDWELLVSYSHHKYIAIVRLSKEDFYIQGELDYQLQANDNVLFISTLHGG